MDLITLSEYKAYVGIKSDTQDAQIKALIPRVSQLAKSYCRRSFVDYVDDSKVEVFKGGNFLLLGEYPVISVGSVETSDDYGATYTALTPYTDYALDLEEGIVVPTGATEFPSKVNGYKVTYNAGFTEIPEDLKIAVLDLLTYYLKNDMAVKSQRDAGSNTVQIEYITRNTLPSHIARVFDLYLANAS